MQQQTTLQKPAGECPDSLIQAIDQHPEASLILLPREQEYDAEAIDGESAPCAPCADSPNMAAMLYSLLMRYVDLLQTARQGQWSREDDREVQTAVSVLSHSGWHIKLPNYR